MFNVRKILNAYDARNMARPFGDIVAERYKAVYMPFQNAGPYSPGTNKAYYFQPDTKLDGSNATIKAIELITATQQQQFNAYGSGRDNVTPAVASYGILYISNTNREVLATIPLYDLIKNVNAGKLLMTYFTEHVWQNCYVEFTDGAAINATLGLQFMVYYDEK